MDEQPLNTRTSASLSAEYAALMARARVVVAELDRRRRTAEAALLALQHA